jgi:hypothetical protein
VAVLLLLLAPARIRLRVAGDAAQGIEVALCWRLLLLHGARSRRLDLAGRPSSRAAIAAPSAPRLAAGRPTASPGPAGTPAPAPTPPPPPDRGRSDRLADAEHALGVARRLFARGAVRVSSAGGWLELALADVGETGRLYGFACALATLVDPQGRLELRPRWDTEDWLAADLALELRVQPLRTAWILLRARRARTVAARGGAVAARTPGSAVAA